MDKNLHTFWAKRSKEDVDKIAIAHLKNTCEKLKPFWSCDQVWNYVKGHEVSKRQENLDNDNIKTKKRMSHPSV